MYTPSVSLGKQVEAFYFTHFFTHSPQTSPQAARLELAHRLIFPITSPKRTKTKSHFEARLKEPDFSEFLFDLVIVSGKFGYI
jgi:hypothetical protein